MRAFRVSEPDELRALIEANAPAHLVFGDGSEIWLSDPLNIALRIGNDLAMFEHQDGIWEGHTLFASRGRQALTNGRAMLGEARRLGVCDIYGLTPLDLKAAHWFNRQLGFRAIREVERPWGKRTFYLNKREQVGPRNNDITATLAR